MIIVNYITIIIVMIIAISTYKYAKFKKLQMCIHVLHIFSYEKQHCQRSLEANSNKKYVLAMCPAVLNSVSEGTLVPHRCSPIITLP